METQVHVGDMIKHEFQTSEFGVIVRTGIVKRVFETSDHRPYCMYQDSRTGQTCDTYLDLGSEQSTITLLTDERQLFPSNFPHEKPMKPYQESKLTQKLRFELKEKPEVVYVISSSSEHEYKVTIFEGRVTGCEQSNGDICQSWHYRQRCHHAVFAMRREEEFQERHIQEAYAGRLHNGVTLQRYNESVISQNSEASIEQRIRERETSQKGSLNGSSQGFSLMR